MNRSGFSIRPLLAPLVVLALLLAGVAAAQEGAGDARPDANLADVIRDHPDLEILSEILADAGVLAQLGEAGQLTVFAPTDAAFEALDEDELAAFRADPELVNFVLRYHMVSATAPGSAIERMTALTTLQGGDLLIESDSEGTWIDGARLVEADLEAANGVVHLIDAVLDPTGIFPKKNQSTIPAGEEGGGTGTE